MKRRFAITGFGAVTPLGVGADLLHERAVACDSGLVNGIGRCTAFKSEDFLNAKQARRADRFCQLAIAAAEEALQQAGFSGDLPYAPERIACVIGSGLGGVASFETQLKVFDEQGDECVSSLLMPMMMANSVTAQVTMRYGFRGESYCVTSACSTGAQAIGAGLRMLANGEAETVIVGGAESATTAIVRAAFRNAGALSQTGNSVPFDRERDGFLIGEGAGIMVLENDDAAARRGAAVLGHILGYGSSSDAHHLTAPEPSAETAAVAVHAALGNADVEPQEVSYVNAHGTGTVLNDQVESAALRLTFGGHLDRTPISSSKSYLGHLLGAAGAVEAIATLQALRHATAPPTVGLRHPDDRLGPLDHVQTARALRAGKRGLIGVSTSFGFGGHNAALVIAVHSDSKDSI